MQRVFPSVLGLGLLAAASAATPAGAIELNRTGTILVISGSLDYGAQHEFKRYVEAQPAQSIRAVYLQSGGGSLDAALDIGRRIRKEGWSTIVDASRGICASACTVLFASGVNRHYLNAGGMTDGVVSFKSARGLGYHEGSDPQSRQAVSYSGNATAYAIAAYYEMGSKAAASLITKAPPNMLYVVSGQTALATGLATSLGKP